MSPNWITSIAITGVGLVAVYYLLRMAWKRGAEEALDLDEEDLIHAKRKKAIDLIKHNFTYHAPDKEKANRYEILRHAMKQVALLIHDMCPDSREKSLAMTALEEVNMWANAAIARAKDVTTGE